MATKTKTVANQGSKPVKVFRARGVKVAVFENKTENNGKEIVYHKLSLQRVYREGEEWKTTNSLSRDDVPVARLLLQQAWSFILDVESKRNAAPGENEH